MELTISIVNWNVVSYLEKCLDSIFRYSAGISFEVIVIDNASSDGSVAMLKEKFPQVKVIENKENVGYGCAHNQAIEIAQGEFILFLNPDTEMLAETLPRSLSFMKKYTRAGALLCREIAGQGAPVGEGAPGETVLLMTAPERFFWFVSKRIQRVLPNPWTREYLVNRVVKARRCAMSGYKIRDKRLTNENGYIFSKLEYLEGGFLLARCSAIEETGGFDPEFFLCGEGEDLTARFKKKGWELYYLVNVRVIHYGAKSSQGLSDADLNLMEEEWEKKHKAKDGRRY